MTPAQAKALLAALPGAVEAQLEPALDAAAELVAFEARQLLATHAAPSTSGSESVGAPRLADAITAGRSSDSHATVRAAAPYARDLEYGTARMAARPFLRPAVANVTADVREHLAAALSNAVAAALDEPR